MQQSIDYQKNRQSASNAKRRCKVTCKQRL
jgi:hypothetical protein